MELLFASSQVLAGICVGVTTLILALTGVAAIQQRQARRNWQQRLRGIQAQDGPAWRVLMQQGRRGWQRALGFLGELSKPRKEGDISRTRGELQRAGYRDADALIRFYGLKLCLMLLLPGLIYCLWRPSGEFLQAFWTVGVILAAVGYIMPSIWLQLRIRRRKEHIMLGFPDALDLLVVCIEAGLGMDAALHRVAEELAIAHPALSDELQVVTAGLRAGQSRRLALQNFSRRVDLEDIRTFASLLIQTERLGMNIAQALRTDADAMRVKRRQRAEELATKLPVKLLFPLIFCIFPTLFVVILLPAGIRIFRALSQVVQN